MGISVTRFGVFGIVLLLTRLFAAQSTVTIATLSPTRIVAGSPATDLTITGNGFSTNSIVRIAGETVPFSFISANTMLTTIPPARLTTPSVITVSVDSATAPFLVYSPNPPSVTAVSDTAGAPGGTNTLRITGSDLIGASVTFSGTGLSASEATGSNTSAVITIVIAPNATFGPRTFTISTPSGSTANCGSTPCVFNVVDGGTWTRTGPMVESRSEHSAVQLLDGRVLVSGGLIGGSSNQTISRTAEIYDPATNVWSATGSMTLGRWGHSSVVLPDGKVLVAGGANGLTSAEIYDPDTGRWSPTGFMVTESFNTRPTVMLDGGILYQNQIYDPATGSFRSSTNPGLAGAVLPSGLIIVIVGSRTYMYTPATDVAVPITLLAQGNLDYVVKLLPDARVFGRVLTYSARDYTRRIDAGIYDYAQDVRTPSGLTGERYNGSPVLLSDGKILLAGSYSGTLPAGPTALRPSFIYDPVSDTVTPAANLNEARDLPVVTLLSDGRVLATGGPLATVSARGFGEIFNPPNVLNPTPIIEASTVTPGLSDQSATSVEITGSNFLPTTAARLGDHKLVTIYLGSQKLIAFVPPALRPALQSTSVVLTNPPPGGGSSSTSGADAGPFITAITPNSAAAGSVVNSVITGNNLDAAVVTVSGSGVSPIPLAGGNSSSLPVIFQISADAALGPRSVTVTTATGAFTAQNIFTVLPANTVPVGTAPLPIHDVEQGAIRTGYIILTPDAGNAAPTAGVTFGMVSNAVVLSEGGILPSPLTTDASVSLDLLSSAGRNLGLAIANPADSAITLNLTLRTEPGTPVSTVPLSVGPRGQISKFVSELFSSNVIGTAFRGSVRIQSTSAFSILGLRFAGVQFAAIPVPGITSISTVPTRLMTSGTIGGPNAVVFAQFAMSGGWATQISLVNDRTATLTGRIDIIDSNGNPLPVPMNGQNSSTYSYSLAPGGSVVIAPRDANGQTPL